MRIGQGFDVHAFEEGDHLVIGGVTIPFHQQFRAHSDGDVLIHALCDALLGALSLGDIGKHFPDTDPQWAGADSRKLLRAVIGLLNQQGWKVGNVDCTVMAERPKILPHAQQMCVFLADDMQVEPSAVSVKATTTEKLGFTGRGEGIAAQAIALLLPL